jgi:hypothetical protein
MRFEKNNRTNPAGRPKGVRNKLDSHAYACVLAHVHHKRGDPAPAEYAQTRLWIALDTTLKTSPRDYARSIISMLPKQVEIDGTVTRVTEIDRIIEVIQEQIALADEQALALADERKLIEHAPH